MVEGHQCHRVVHAHRAALVGKRTAASSPNGRLADGAAAIDGRVLTSCDAHGKQLFYRWAADDGRPAAVVAIHFGMSGRFSVSRAPHAGALPPAKPTTRLRLVADADDGRGGVLVADLSAMTVLAGGPEVEAARRAVLGADPLRADADPDAAFEALARSSKSIGHCLMDQQITPGVGNIFRAEILAAAGVHPDLPARAVPRPVFDSIWRHAVAMMRASFETGSIITTGGVATPADAGARRIVYNRAACAVCGARVVSWDISGRTAYACETCQPRPAKAEAAAKVRAATVFASGCAAPSAAEAAADPAALTVASLKARLAAAGAPTGGRKADLVARVKGLSGGGGSGGALPTPGTAGLVPASAAEAAAEKAAAGEKRNVEHVPQDADDATAGMKPITPSPRKRRARA